MGAQVKVLQKGKIKIPAKSRQRLGINDGDYLELEIIWNRLVLLPPNIVPNPTDRLCGLAEGVAINEPIKRGLRRAAADRVAYKTLRTKK